MTNAAFSKGNVAREIGKKPVVVLPLADYERMQEDLEMLRSKSLPRKIAKARAEVKRGLALSLREVKRKLKLR